MARRFDFADDALVVRYGGLDALLAVTTAVRIPYASIQDVRLGLAEVPAAFAWRVGLSTGPFSDHRMGRFWVGGRKLFLDLRDRSRAVVVDLSGAGAVYDRVAIEPDHDPEGLAEKLRARQTT
jgi:hypothetical protein